mmetsp:Transcript_16061/g.39724  ORF Transcript_16061/g.39724 Transcript_16061/m.39724 type:complete len:229 (+) Transcript_16061:1170-1856(+)
MEGAGGQLEDDTGGNRASLRKVTRRGQGRLPLPLPGRQLGPNPPLPRQKLHRRVREGVPQDLRHSQGRASQASPAPLSLDVEPERAGADSAAEGRHRRGDPLRAREQHLECALGVEGHRERETDHREHDLRVGAGQGDRLGRIVRPPGALPRVRAGPLHHDGPLHAPRHPEGALQRLAPDALRKNTRRLAGGVRRRRSRRRAVSGSPLGLAPTSRGKRISLIQTTLNR